jgi:cyclin-dependent kinase-like
VGYKFPDTINKPESIEKRYVGKLSKKALNLMSGMLIMDPEDRYTAADCLGDPFFDSVREPEVEKLLANYKVSNAQHTS